MSAFHQSVLLTESVDFLNVKPGGLYIDATAGGGGHSEQILARGGKVLAIDQDQEAIDFIKSQFQISNFKFQIGKDVVLVKSNFVHIKKIAEEHGFTSVSGIIFDLGVSSHQLAEAKRGFSFQKLGPLDMRMDTRSNVTAYDIVNHFDKRRLNEIFASFGQEQLSLAIADAIISTRQVRQINSTSELEKIIAEVYRKKGKKTKLHQATKVFQALRIVVNSELLNLEEALPQTTKLLVKNGRLVVISFHSLEDKIVKRFFRESNDLKVLTKKPIGPNSFELSKNPRSRSAKLRAAEKLEI